MEMSAAGGGQGTAGRCQNSRTVKRRRWGGLRQQWKLLGLFEIDQHHEFYGLTCMMKEGLATAIQKSTDNTLTKPGPDFTMETFAGPVFASLRSSLGMSEQEYQQSLCSEHCYLQFISNSKSKADFFLTNDKHERINARYDIKGCEVSRWTDPAPEGSQIIVVLKDLNFEGQYITLDQQRPWLLRQVEIDTQFLRRLNVLDYSLLLAHQPLHQDERHQSLSFASSVNPGSTELSDFRVQNRRLLPNLKNPLHVIDGPEQRYFIGIIDIFTVYGFKKRLEHLWKRLRHPGRTFSTVSPQTYCLRLCQWVQDHTK
uniref:Phosphatidylinositol-4-phosphate 5-kinase-like 1 n=1 Tax=Sphaeramia orbicularis TaxID=375764 RepID=A0A673B197_9TELE